MKFLMHSHAYREDRVKGGTLLYSCILYDECLSYIKINGMHTGKILRQNT